MVNPRVAEPEVPHVPRSSAVVELALSSCLPYALQYSPAHRDSGDPGESKLTITIPLTKQQQRRRSGQSSSGEPAETPAAPQPQQLPMGAISVLSPAQCPLQPACPEPAQAQAQALPSVASPAGKTKSPGQPLPAHALSNQTAGPGHPPPASLTHSTAQSETPLTYISSVYV